MSRRSRSLSLGTPKYLPYEAQHVLLNTVQRLLEESCFEFAKTWFGPDPRVKEWTTPSQVEISKWRDLLGNARVSQEALDGSVQTPLKVLLQEATYIRNNAVHRNQVLVEDIRKMLNSSIQLTMMLRDQTRSTKLEGIRSRLIREVYVRDDNRARATVQYRKSRDDIDRRKEPLLRSFDKLRDEEEDAVTVFEKDSALHDNALQSSMIKFINQVIHTGEEVARITPIANFAQKAQPIVENSSTVTDDKFGKGQGRDDDDIQFISKSDFEVATLGSRKAEKKPARDVRSESKDQTVSVKQDHDEGEILPITHTVVNFAMVRSTPGSCHKYGSGTPRALSVVRNHPGTESEDTDSPSRQLVLEANMANDIRELSFDEYDILGQLDAALDCQLLRRVPSSDLKATDRSSAPSPDVVTSGVDVANASTISTTTADSVSVIESTNLRKEDITQTAAGALAVEFGKPWKPASNRPVPATKPDKPQGIFPQIAIGPPVAALDKPSVSIIEREESKKVNLSNMHPWRKRKAASPLSERDPASCNSMMPTRPHAQLPQPNISTGMVPNTTGIQATTPIVRLPPMKSFEDVSKFAKDVGFNPGNLAALNKSEDTMRFDLTPPALFSATGVPQETQDANILMSRQAATWERRRILVGCLSFTPSKTEVERLFVGYNVTRIDFPEMWIMGDEKGPAGCVFVDLATAAQAKLFIQKLSDEPKIRNCRVSIRLATEPWKGPNASRKVLSVSAKNKNQKKRAHPPAHPLAHPSAVANISRKSQPIGKRTCSYYAEMRKSQPDGQSSKKQKLVTEEVKDSGAASMN